MSILRYEMNKLKDLEDKAYNEIRPDEIAEIENVFASSECKYFLYEFRDKDGYIDIPFFGDLPEIDQIKSKLSIKFNRASQEDLEELKKGS